MNGVEVLRGVEANIVDMDGNIDMPVEVVSFYLDIVLAGFHDSTGYTGKTREENTRSMVAAIKNPHVHIISHPGNPKYPVDIEEVMLAAKTFNKAVELNNYSFVARPNSFPCCSEFAKMARKYQVLVAINSDAHICYNVGENDKALALALKEAIPPSQILNSSARKIKAYLDYHKHQAQILKGA